MSGESSETIPEGSRGTAPEMVETLVYFYVLKDPRDSKIRYVGRTVDPVQRLRHHIYEAKKKNKNRRERWVVSLLRRNLEPVLQVVYQLKCTVDVAAQTERTLIKKLKGRFDLVNGVDRGLGGKVSTKVCYQYSLTTGECLGSYCNVNQASLATGVKDVNIARCCKNANGYGTKTAGGFFWSYLPYNKYPHQYVEEWRALSGKCVIGTSRDGIQTEYQSARIASRSTGVCHKKISACANGKRKSSGGYTWKFKS